MRPKKKSPYHREVRLLRLGKEIEELEEESEERNRSQQRRSFLKKVSSSVKGPLAPPTKPFLELGEARDSQDSIYQICEPRGPKHQDLASIIG
jgi:hypothetical protein